jgi:S-formylglutathione hydrolase
MGHSMGGHGALVMGLRHPEMFSRIVAFAPIVNPSAVPWGIKALKGYLGDGGTPEGRAQWGAYDACELLRQGRRHPAPIVIYQGGKDEFLGTQLEPEVFERLARELGQECVLRWCDDYDHSYYFVASFLPEVVP